jgi:hypothetical protein
MANVSSSITSIFNFKSTAYALLWTFVIVAVLSLLIFVILKIRERKKYIVLAEVVPKWSITYDKEKDFIIKEKKTIFGVKKVKVPVEPEQKMITSLIPARYEVNDDGTINLFLKTKPQAVVSSITYDFFVPINYKNYKLYIKLVRYSAMDYKPCKVKIEGLYEIRKLYDSDAVYVTTKTIDEIVKKFEGRSKWEKYAPYVTMILMGFIFLLAMYFMTDSFKEGIKMFTNSLGGFTQQIENLTKTLLVASK